MDTKTYTEKALETESRVDAIVVDPYFLGSIIQVMIAAGNMLDQVKKHVFYDREYDSDQLVVEFTNIVGSLDAMKQQITEIKQSDIKMMPYPHEAHTNFNPRIFHSIVGMATESVELLEALVQPEFDRVNFIEELGDLSWYQAIGVDAADTTFDEVLDININKLSSGEKARYEDGFSSDDANNRDLDAERKILEGDD